jgi:antitoxin component YwqK of YwqJK toxin-antitoxin module
VATGYNPGTAESYEYAQTPESRATALEMVLLARSITTRGAAGDVGDLVPVTELVLKSTTVSDRLLNWAEPHIRQRWQYADPEVRFWLRQGLSHAGRWLRPLAQPQTLNIVPSPIDEARRNNAFTDFTPIEGWLYRRWKAGVPAAHLVRLAERALTLTHLPDGPFSAVFPDSRQQAQVGTLKGNVLVGLWKTWYPDGQLRYVGSFDPAGKRTGAWKAWYPSGQLARSGRYQNGVFTGMEWSDSVGHTIVRQDSVWQGKPVAHKSYDQRQRLTSASRKLSDGKAETTEYDSTGQVTKRTLFDPVQFTTTTLYARSTYHNGQIRSILEVKDGQTSFQAYYPDGVQRLSYSCTDFQKPYPVIVYSPEGLRHVEYLAMPRNWKGNETFTRTVWSEAKVRLAEFSYGADKILRRTYLIPEKSCAGTPGPCTAYEHSQDPGTHEIWSITETPCIDGKPHGKAVSYRTEGGVYSYTHYTHGQQHGPMKRYSITVDDEATCKLIEAGQYSDGRKTGTWRTYLHNKPRWGSVTVQETNYVNGVAQGKPTERIEPD